MDFEEDNSWLYAEDLDGNASGKLGRVEVDGTDDILLPWQHTNTEELKLWNLGGTFATSRSVTFNLDNGHSQSYSLTMPKYRPNTSDTLVVHNHDGANDVTLTWDTFIINAGEGLTKTGNTIDVVFNSVETQLLSNSSSGQFLFNSSDTIV